MVSVAEDPPLGLFPRSSCPPARWCFVFTWEPALTFHDSATTVKQLLLPLFQVWELISIVVRRLCKLRSTAWLAQLPLHLPHAHARLTTLRASGRGSPTGEHCWPSPTLLLRLHLLHLTGFAPVPSTSVAGVLTTASLSLSPSLLSLPLALLAHPARAVGQVVLSAS